MAGSSTSCNVAVISLSVPAPPTNKLPVITNPPLYTNKCRIFHLIISHTKTSSPVPIHITRSSSSPSSSAPIIVEEEESGSPTTDDSLPIQSESALDSKSLASVRGCKACGRDEIEMGCNGEGRIQGGIATVPGFGWWPIKAYRPCPAFVAAGGRYRRTGQSMDEVASGGGGKTPSKKKK